MGVKLLGVYDLELFRYLKKVGVKNFAFDLRPTSFNFTPMKKITEMLDTAGDVDDTYSFMFGSEKEFVIRQLMTYVRRRPALGERNCLLEFTDSKDLEACSNFELPFLWHFADRVDYRQISKHQLLAGVSFSYEYLEGLRDSNQLYPFIMEFMALKRDEQWVDLRLDWSDHLSESVTDFMQAKTYSYEISSKVEDGYRDVNMGLISSHLDHAKRILNLEP